MANPQLLEYVRAQRAAGLSKEDIVKAAAPGGWTPADIDEVFAVLEGKPVAPPKPPAPPPSPPPAAAPGPAQPRVITPPPQPVVPTPPPTPAYTPRPMVSPAEITTAKAPGRGKKRLFTTLITLVVIAALGAGGYFFVWPFVQDAIEALSSTPAELENLPPAPPLETTEDFPPVETTPAPTSTELEESSAATTSEESTATTSAQ